MKLLKFGILVCTLTFSGLANSAWFTSKIATIHTYLNGGIYVYTETNHECGSNRIGFDSSALGFQRIYSALLAYEIQGREVKFAISCNGTNAVADRVVSVK